MLVGDMVDNSDGMGSDGGACLRPIIDYGPWVPLASLEDSFGSALDAAREDHTLETITIGPVTFGRFVVRAAHGKIEVVWRSVPETCERYGITSRCVSQRVARGEFQKRYMGGIEEVAVVPGVQTASKAADTITAVPDILEGKDAE